MIREAIAARQGLLLVIAGAAAAGTAAWQLSSTQYTAFANVDIEPRVDSPDPAPSQATDVPAIAGNAPYINADLDGDGTPEVIVRADGRAGPVVVVQTFDHQTTLGSVSLAGGGCESEFTVDNGELIVERYRLDKSERCTNVGRERYRVAHGLVVPSDR